MANLKVLRQRIVSVQSTIKITSAMKMVAASKLKKFQDQKDIWSEYEQEFKRMMEEAFSQSDPLEGEKNWILPQTSSTKIAVLVLSASKGLCGPFNNSIIKETKLVIQKLTNQGFEPHLFFIGRRAKDALNVKFSKYFSNYMIDDHDTDHEISQSLATHLAEAFLRGQYREVKVIFNQYQSVVTQKPNMMDLLPFKIEPRNVKQAFICEIEPSPSELLKKLAPRYLEVLILKTLIETHVGEQASRMVAMDAATRSAKEMVDSLKLQLNRTRQALITKELIEVISGAEAAL